MYAIVKTGGKQYRVSAGDALNIEKIDGKVGDKVALTAICVVDGDKVTTDPVAATKVKVEAEIVEQFKDKKVIVFKFKKRKNYQRKVGHRQQLTRVKIVSVGDEKAPAKKVSVKPATKKTTADMTAKPVTKTATAKKTDAKSTTAEKKTASTKKPTTKSADSTKKATTTKKATPKAETKAEKTDKE